MIAGLIARLIALGVPARFAKPLLIAAAVVLLLVALGTAKCAYDRSVIKDYTAGQQAKQTKVERKADANLEARKDQDAAAAQQRKEEIDHATQGIPDQALSARQRARVCVELVRQAKAAGRPVPAACAS